MKNLYYFKRLAFAAMALVAFLLSASSVEAQNYKKGAWVEEFTGTWCGHCPRGAWALDSIEHYMPDHAIVVSWHNGSDDEPMRNPASDTMASGFGISGYPGVVFQRISKMGIGTFPNDGVSAAMNTEALKAPLIDFRLVNVSYNPASRELDFDLDMTPFLKNLSKLPTSDTAKYTTTVIVTEDGIVEDQVNYGYGGLDNPIEGFVHMNVGRGSIGKVLGDDFPYSTTSASQTLPARKHYSYIVPQGWNHDKLRIKILFAARHPKTGQNPYNTFKSLEAKQTPYLTTLPPVAPNMVYAVTPNDGGLQPVGPVKLFWGKGGNVDNVKIEYSDNGTASWEPIIASTNVSPYEWTPPVSAEGKQVTVRVSWATNAAVNGSTGLFTIAAAPKGSIIVTKPLQNDVLTAGTTTSINFSVTQPVTTNKTIEYSLDLGQNWTKIADLTTPALTYSWMVPDVESDQAMIRITDQSSEAIVGTSGVFKIEKTVVPSPTFKSFTLTGATSGNIPAGGTVQFRWEMQDGTLPGPYDIQMSTNKVDWSQADIIVSSIPNTSTSTFWTAPTDEYMPEVYFRITDNTGEVGHHFLASGGAAFSIGTQGAVKNNGGAPTAFRLSTNYPNPFGSMTNINFDVPERSFVTIVVRNELGQEVARLANGMLDAGNYTADFNASQLAAGLYTYTLESGATKLTGKMSVVR
jgi:hypothetical protein